MTERNATCKELKIKEGKARIYVPNAKPDKSSPVFYNSRMELQRSINIALLNAIENKNMAIADILAASGIRGIRCLLEIPKSKILHVAMNDVNPGAVKLMKRNLNRNKISRKRYSISNQDASQFILKSKGFHYIDIDPFGSPAPFLDAACKKISREGIIAITATDTAALSGSAPAACIRKYWAIPLRNEFMHEIGLRILARKAQLVASQYGKALAPIYCHSTEHYMRLYLKVEKSRLSIASMFEKHGNIAYCNNCLNRFSAKSYSPQCSICKSQTLMAGPLWLGSLWDPDLAISIAKYVSKSKYNTESRRLTWTIAEESKVSTVVGYYETHRWAQLLKTTVPKREDLLTELLKLGISSSPTHFSATGIRTTADPLQFKKVFLSTI